MAGEDEAYNVYDKAWRGDKDINAIYRPTKNADKDAFGDDLDKIMSSSRSVKQELSDSSLTFFGIFL